LTAPAVRRTIQVDGLGAAPLVPHRRQWNTEKRRCRSAAGAAASWVKEMRVFGVRCDRVRRQYP
jgi:hypothetical protein